MDRISNTDHLVILLREKLLQRARSAGSGKGHPASEANARGGVLALAGAGGVDDRQLGRALLQSILAEQFGPDLINDAKFQQVVDGVADTLRSDENSAKLLTRLVQELRTAAT